MSESIPAQISIGGLIEHAAIPHLLVAISRDGAGPDWGAGWEISDVEEFREYCQGLTTLDLYDEQANYGNLPNLVDCCLHYGIAYDIRHDAKYEYAASLYMFRPGMVRPAWFPTTADGQRYIDRDDVVNALADYHTAMSQGVGTRESLFAVLLDRLTALCAPEIPPLEPLRLGDDPHVAVRRVGRYRRIDLEP